MSSSSHAANALPGAAPLRAVVESPTLIEDLLAAVIGETQAQKTLDPAAVSKTAGSPAASPSARYTAWQRLLGEKSLERRLELWRVLSGQPNADIRSLALSLGSAIAQVDGLIGEQVDAMLHHPVLQRLEASWRGLWFLTQKAAQAVETAEESDRRPQVRVRFLHLPLREFIRDFDQAIEFDQTQLFKKIYESEFGTPGGTPFGAIVGDYEFTNHPEHVEKLGKMAGVSATAFAPFLTGGSPNLLGIDTYSSLELPLNLENVFAGPDYLKWRALREMPDSRFVGLTLPRTLMRLPYRNDEVLNHGFRYAEDVDGPDRKKYLFGNSAYALAAVLVRSFADCGWFADIRGAERGADAGGLVSGLPVHSFSTDRRGVAPKFSTEVALSESVEQELNGLGFISLCHCHDTDYCVFYNNASLAKPATYDDPAANANARASAMLQYVFCTARFAHYLKVIALNKVGSVDGPEALESVLNRWLNDYVTDERASPETKARYPLREANVRVERMPGAPGAYRMAIQLLPHFQLDRLTASLRMVTRLTRQES